MTEQLVLAILLSAGVSLLSWRATFLTADGALAQFVLGTVLLGLGGWKWTVPMVVFFGTSSIISQLWKRRRAVAETFFEKSSRRDAGQVIANGGVAGLATLGWSFTHNESLYAFYLGAVAAATADTWATEIGTLSKTPPVLITTLKRVERGRSGAVSLLGTTAGLAGASVISLTSLPWIEASQMLFLVFVATASGFVGSFADSLTGALAQARFQCTVCRKTTERRSHCQQESVQIGGFNLIRNDQVNLICTAVGGATAYFLWAQS